MTDKPEALRLADEIVEDYCRCLDAYKDRGRIDPQCESCNTENWRHRAAAELRRLHEVNVELVEALKLALSAHGTLLLSDPPQEAWKTYNVEAKARAAAEAALAAQRAADEASAKAKREAAEREAFLRQQQDAFEAEKREAEAKLKAEQG